MYNAHLHTSLLYINLLLSIPFFCDVLHKLTCRQSTILWPLQKMLPMSGPQWLWGHWFGMLSGPPTSPSSKVWAFLQRFRWSPWSGATAGCLVKNDPRDPRGSTGSKLLGNRKASENIKSQELLALDIDGMKSWIFRSIGAGG